MEKISLIEDKIEKTHQQLSLEENYSDPDKAYILSQQQVTLEEELEEWTKAWEEVGEKLQEYR